MLVRCDALIPTLLDALFLAPEHPRKDMDETLRAGVQCDGAECFLQLALFEPGKELLEQNPEALDALRLLTDGGLTKEAREHASGALVAVEGLAPPPAPTPGDQKHIMMSCKSSLREPAWILYYATISTPDQQPLRPSQSMLNISKKRWLFPKVANES